MFAWPSSLAPTLCKAYGFTQKMIFLSVISSASVITFISILGILFLTFIFGVLSAYFVSFYNLLIDKGFKFEILEKSNLSKELNLEKTYNNIFKNKDLFLEELYESCFDDEDLFEENEKKYNEIKDIVEKYYREYGLSINDLYKLNTLF